MIVFSVMVIAATVQVAQFEAGTLTLAGLLMGLLILFYVISAPLVGLIAAVIYGALLMLAEDIALMGMDTALKTFVGLFVLGWIIQFVGHIFEKRKPALFDNLMQIFLAPSFLIAEVLFLFGLEKGLKAEIDARIHTYLPKDEQLS